ncbi:MAG: pilin [Lewinellaceae bacterium]|nr:pilin [Lewinellaceae bacterium]
MIIGISDLSSQSSCDPIPCIGNCCTGGCDGGDGGAGGSGHTVIKGAIDPNDLIPPASVGDKGWVRRDDNVLPFQLLFENLPAATLPAQRVVVTVPIGANVDYSSFRLGSFGFGNYYFNVADNTSQLDGVLPLSGQLGVDVHVTAGINTQTGVAEWVFQSLDPLTGQPPTDIDAGFLPPNDPNTGQGEGFCHFSISPDPASQTEDEIDFMADIKFDEADIIVTPMALLTIDADAPVSTVSPIVTAPDAQHLRLQWSGTDVGSGLMNYTLFVSEEGGSYRPWLVETDTTAGLLNATLGKTYRIYVIARDSVRNVEDKPPFDLEITFTPDLIQGGSQLTARVFLLGNYDQSTGLMKDELRQLSLLPLSQPYTATLGYTHTGTESVASSVFAVTGNDAIVDWILVELRDKANPGQALYSRAALLQRDGDIVDTDGFSPLTFTGTPADDYYVVVRHRNHLGIGTSTPVAIGSVPVTLDFTGGSVATFGTDAQAHIGGKYLLWSGDANGDGKVIYAGSGTDVNAISSKVFTNPLNTTFSPTFPLQGYFREDLNLDGKVIYAGAGTDVNFISLPVFSAPANLVALSPTFVLTALLP